MDNKLITLCITLVVGVILAGSVLMPVLNDATETHKTFTNNGAYSMQLLTAESEETTLVWDHTKPNIISVNDVEFTVNVLNFGEPVLISDEWMIRLYQDNIYIAGAGITNPFNIGASIANETDMTMVCNNGTATVTVNSDPVATATLSYTTAYAVGAGDYVVVVPDSDVYLNGDSMVANSSLSTLFGTEYGLSFNGSIDDEPITVTISGSGVTATASITNAAVSGFEDLYKAGNIIVTADDGDTTDTATYHYYVAPAKVTAERSQHFDAAEIALLNALPILIIVCLVMVGVGAIVVKNRD